MTEEKKYRRRPTSEEEKIWNEKKKRMRRADMAIEKPMIWLTWYAIGILTTLVISLVRRFM